MVLFTFQNETSNQCRADATILAVGNSILIPGGDDKDTVIETIRNQKQSFSPLVFIFGADKFPDSMLLIRHELEPLKKCSKIRLPTMNATILPLRLSEHLIVCIGERHKIDGNRFLTPHTVPNAE